jgi:hypothetical protein
MPALLSVLKKSMPGWMSSADPPFASAAAQRPRNAAFALVGSPLRATLPLYAGLFRSLNVFGQVPPTLAALQPREI